MKKNTNNIIIILIITLVAIFSVNIYLAIHNKSKSEEPKTPEEIIDIKTVETLSEDESDVIGHLKIESIGLDAIIKDGTELSTLKEAIGHFKDSAYLTGNVCLAAHNRGYNQNFFENLKDVEMDAEIIYKTKYSEKKYYVSEIKEIEETDLSVLNPTENNQLTLITCDANQREKRLCVIATER